MCKGKECAAPQLAAEVERLRAENAELRVCLREQMCDVEESTTWAAPAHYCGGPDAQCDGDCVEYARFADRRARARAALKGGE